MKIVSKTGLGLLAIACVVALVEYTGIGGRTEAASVEGYGGETQVPDGGTQPNRWASNEQQRPSAARRGDAPPMPPPLNTQLGQQVPIVDQNGFGQPVTAATVAIPVGWQSGGGITWNNDTSCANNQMQFNWSTIGPDSLTAIAIMPGFHWQVQGSQIDDNPCPVAPFRSNQEFLTATAQKLRPGVRILGYEKNPALERQSVEKAGGGQYMQGVQHDAGTLLIAYEQDGVAMEEALIAITLFNAKPGGAMGGASAMYSVRAPRGRLDIGLAQRVADTMQPNPQYMAAAQERIRATIERWRGQRSQAINDWHNRQMAITNARGNADRHAIRMRGNQETASIYNAIAVNSGATSDRMHKTTMSGIGEYDRYRGVDGGEVRNPIHNGPTVFQNTNDPSQIISTDDPYARPPSGYTELERQQ